MFDFFKRKPEAEPKVEAPVPESPPPPPAEPPAAKPSWTERLKAGLGLSRAKLGSALTGVFARRKLDAESLEQLEEALLISAGIAGQRRAKPRGGEVESLARC